MKESCRQPKEHAKEVEIKWLMEEEEGVSKTEVSKAPHNIRVLHKNGSNIIHQNTLHT